jgi:uncharacterized protein (TIGR02246 family)
MRCRTLASLLATMASLLLSGGAYAQQAGPEDAAVGKLVADFTAAINRADATAYGALHVDNAFVIDEGVVLVGRQSNIDKFKADLAGSSKGMKFISHKVDHLRYLTPTLALGTTSWEVSIPNQPNMKGVAFFVATKRGNRWLFEGWQAAALKP